ncbi:hypothetical protein DMN91_005499 [Ooceraea biroi]|uniref:Uncharacterized protein n=1 Tax=Ooceraea biroi TaxID=2015173 RepID=A0A3L8DLD4_OOCBI|nr:uncharacterized protein LOC105280903 [Ooceraea biroi]RLU21126.1 hypothetical protein DMN91_005499 [Ooceraea biroi]
MRHLTGGAVDEQLLQTLWLQRMPSRVQELLSVVEGIPLDKLADLADKTLERAFPSITVAGASTSVAEPNLLSAIEQLTQQIQRLTADKEGGRRSRSKRRGRSQSCSQTRDKTQSAKHRYYHVRFGEKARKCTQPCAWVKALANKSTSEAEN